MLTERAPVYVRDRSGNTPLSDAVRNKNFQCIELLRNAGAQLKVRNLGFSETSFNISELDEPVKVIIIWLMNCARWLCLVI